MQKKANFLTNFLTSTWHNFSLRVKIHSTAQHSTAQHSTAQHSTAQHSTSYNSARNIISGYMHFKSNITTFSHRETAHDAGKIMSCTWAFISVLQCLENRNKGESRVKVKRPSYDICQYHDSWFHVLTSYYKELLLLIF